MSTIESAYLRESRRVIYTACEDMNFVWDERDVQEFDKMWREGLSITDMAVAFSRPTEEVALLAMDRAMNDHIGPRKGGMFGKEMLA